MISLPAIRKFFLFFALIVPAFLPDVFPQTTFSGNGNWSDPSRWSSGVPGAATSATIAVNATCTINSPAVCGSLTLAGNSNLSITGTDSLIVSGAILISNNINQATSSINVGSGSLQGNSLAVNGSNGQRKAELSVGSGSVYISGNISFSGSQSNANAVIRFNGSGRVTIGGDLGSGGVIIPGSGTMAFNGNSRQTIQETTLISFNNMQINNSAGVALSGDLNINGILSFLNGSLLTDTNNITLGENSSLTGEGELKYLVGNLSISRMIGAGQENNFAGIGLNIGSGPDDLGTVTVRRISGSAGRVSAGGNEGINRKWEITSTNPPLNGRIVSLSWVSDDDNSVDLSNAVVFRSSDGGSQWEAVGIPQDVSSNRTIIVATNSFSEWTVGDASAPLPVEFSSFTGYSSENNVFLKWRTETEIQNYGFEIEKCKKNNTEWEKIGFISGHGNSNAPRDYTFTDVKPEGGTYYYRLKQIDTNGNFEYSNEIEVTVIKIPAGFLLEQNYPNPFNPLTKIKFSVDKTSHTVLKVYDMLGKEVQVLFDQTAVGGEVYSVDFNTSSVNGQLSSGIYYYSLNNSSRQISRKMMLVK